MVFPLFYLFWAAFFIKPLSTTPTLDQLSCGIRHGSKGSGISRFDFDFMSCHDQKYIYIYSSYNHGNPWQSMAISIFFWCPSLGANPSSFGCSDAETWSECTDLLPACSASRDAQWPSGHHLVGEGDLSANLRPQKMGYLARWIS